MIIIITIVTLLLLSCATSENDTGDTNNSNITNILWIENSSQRPPISEIEEGVRVIEYREVDLSKSSRWDGLFWYEVGFEVEPTHSTAQILVQDIESRYDAVRSSDAIFESERGNVPISEDLNFGLMLIKHDPGQNIWIYIYWDVDFLINGPGSSFYIAVDGDTSEVIRMWVE